MASNRYGYMARVGVDTSGMKDADTAVRNLSNELRAVDNIIRQGNASTEIYSQRNEILSQEINTLTQKLERLRSAEAEISRARANNDISAEQYRAYQREIANTEAALEMFERNLYGYIAYTHSDELRINVVDGKHVGFRIKFRDKYVLSFNTYIKGSNGTSYTYASSTFYNGDIKTFTQLTLDNADMSVTERRIGADFICRLNTYCTYKANGGSGPQIPFD